MCVCVCSWALVEVLSTLVCECPFALLDLLTHKYLFKLLYIIKLKIKFLHL